MVRTLVKPDKQNISITLPKEFLGKQVEVIAFTIDETIDIPEIKDVPVTHFATESILSKDWLSPEEDEIWRNL